MSLAEFGAFITGRENTSVAEAATRSSSSMREAMPFSGRSGGSRWGADGGPLAFSIRNGFVPFDFPMRILSVGRNRAAILAALNMGNRTVDTVLGNRLIELRSRIAEGFDAGNWEELGLLTGTSNLINKHPRLLRSLSWNDEDYAGNVLTVLRQIVERDPPTLSVIEAYLDEHFPGESTYISAKPSDRRITFAPYVFQVPDGHVEFDLVAVMMPFAREFDTTYGAIKQASKACDLRCLRADDIWEDATIVQDVFSIIFRAQVVVVDFTGKNPNVMYETGIAHTLGKHVVPISRSLEDVPFDMRHHRVLNYFPNKEGITKLTSDLQAKLRQFRVGTSAETPRMQEEGTEIQF
jgi:AbiJ N-terminal domain 5